MFAPGLVAISRDPEKFRKQHPELAPTKSCGIEWIAGDISAPGEWMERVSDIAFTHVLHAATPADPVMIREQPAEMTRIVVYGTRNVLSATHKLSKKTRWLLTSTGGIYGRQPPELERVPESYDPDSKLQALLNAYSAGKRVAEADVQKSKFAWTIARPFAFVGPHLPLDAEYAVGNFIRDALKGGPIQIAGDGTPLRSYLYASELVTWLWTMLLDPRAIGKTLNLGSEDSISIEALAHAVADECVRRGMPRPAIQLAKTPVQGAMPDRYVPSTQAARDLLSLSQKIPLSEGLKSTFDFLESKP